MEDLSKKKCVPCEGNIPAFDYNEIHKYLKYQLFVNFVLIIKIDEKLYSICSLLHF